MVKWKTIAGVLLIFVLGGLLGSLVTGWVLKRQHPLFRRDPAERLAFIMQRLAERLDLTEAQKPPIEAVLRRIDDRMHQHFQQQRAEMRRIIDEQSTAIKPLLTPAQQEKYDAFRREMEARRRDRPRPPPPPE
jgi:hypothetical protein